MTFKEILRFAEIEELYAMIEAAAGLSLFKAAAMTYDELKLRRVWSE